MAETETGVESKEQAPDWSAKAAINFVNPQNQKRVVVAMFMQMRIGKLSYQALLKDNPQNETLYELVSLE